MPILDVKAQPFWPASEPFLWRRAMSRYDPIFGTKPKNSVNSGPKKPVETAAAPIEELALTPPAGTQVRQVFIGAHNEKIPALLDPNTRTCYPIKE